MKRPLWMLIWIVVYGCGSSPSEREPAAAVNAAGSAGVVPTTNRAGASGMAGAVDAPPCDASSGALTIASAPLSLTMPLRFADQVALTGDGEPLPELALQNPSAGLRWQGDRSFLLSDTGFWEVQAPGPARWYPTSSSVLWGVRAGDLDGDGDLDLLVLSMSLDPSIGADADAGSAPGSPLASRLSVWERGPDGLTERTVLRNAPGMSFPMPYELADVDGDADLDVVTYERGVALGYVNHGAFQFTRDPLSDSAPPSENFGALRVHAADRNGDGLLDLLVVGGDPIANPLENQTFVMLGERPGWFGGPGPSTSGKSPLVPHGPDGIGIGIADVTGDGLADVLMQDPAAPDVGTIRLHMSTSPVTLSPALELSGLGFGFADVDGDGATDLVTTRGAQLLALLSRTAGAFEERELGEHADTSLLSFVVSPAGPAVHVLRKPTCSGEQAHR